MQSIRNFIKRKKKRLKKKGSCSRELYITPEQSTESTPSTTLPKSLETQVTWAKLLAENFLIDTTSKSSPGYRFRKK
jgi:hypothetical protein